MRKPISESTALATLFDYYNPNWRVLDGPHYFETDIKPALRAFGLTPSGKSTPSAASPFIMLRLTAELNPEALTTLVELPYEDTVVLVPHRLLRSPTFLSVFRRRPPSRMILGVRSGLWWAVWLSRERSYTKLFLSTAEYRWKS